VTTHDDDGPAFGNKLYTMPPRPDQSPRPSPVLRAAEAVERAIEAARIGDPNAGAYRITAHQQIQSFEAFVERLQGDLVALRQRFDDAFSAASPSPQE
jgi:alkanesulfonate monooxygenase SsuD/methylene tetrahydromethanopterin reductase-like flavin-dependent oxidoreductase (luciferase family)